MGPFKAGLACAAGAAALHFVPSVVSLGQWVPIRTLPGDLCTWRGPRTDKVALTFDDGPAPGDTDRILDRLDGLGVRATFFCLGSNVEQSPDLIAEMVSRGHAVGVHGYEHAHHLFRSPRWVARDLARAVEIIDDLSPAPVRWFRPPYGQTTGPTMWASYQAGLRIVLWSAWGREWSAGDADEVVNRVETGLVPGAIVLLHDSEGTSPPGTARRVFDALPRIVDRLVARDLAPVTLDDLLMP